MNTPFVRKIVSNPSTCLFVQRFLCERKCGFYRQHIPSSLHILCSHFVGLSSPTRSLFIEKKRFFGKRQITWHIWSGQVQFVKNLPRCSLMDRLLWYDRSQFRHIYVHEPIMDLIFLYIGQEPMVSAVASNKTDKYLLARFPVLIWSFFILLSVLKSSYFFFERGRRHIFYGGERNYTPPPPFNVSSETGTGSTIRLADSYKNPTEELEF